MTSSSTPRAFDVRHLQLARAAFAALAAIMVTFSPDHSAPLGLGVFSGFALATGLVFGLAAWLVFRRGERMIPVLLASVSIVAGLVSSVGAWRTTGVFFGVVIAWALVSGLVELLGALRDRKAGRTAGVRDGMLIGILTIVLAAVLLLTPAQYALDYDITGAGSFTLTGITIAVGLFGGYAAVVAVFLAIAGFSPRRPEPVAAVSPEEAAS
ncbi:acyl-CoA synthetase [Microbacterium proteolyticum]|uniref:acyl-CoA synthetase n=1 Tax=Microbacterium proteolyticum TaxID=1572644 RepID=UPI001FAD8F1F|nr:acyl-CoA synthetase [Microbacterium proteolyticum]MCI9857901.1 acyl-CoA synthetase [Microbacterium proteolyticum]